MEPKIDADLKPGWQTTEFWAPIVALVVSALALLHIVPSADQANLSNLLTGLVAALIGLGGPIALIGTYIKSRINAKEALLKMEWEERTYTRDLEQQRYTLAEFGHPGDPPIPPPNPAPDGK